MFAVKSLFSTSSFAFTFQPSTPLYNSAGNKYALQSGKHLFSFSLLDETRRYSLCVPDERDLRFASTVSNMNPRNTILKDHYKDKIPGDQSIEHLKNCFLSSTAMGDVRNGGRSC